MNLGSFSRLDIDLVRLAGKDRLYEYRRRVDGLPFFFYTASFGIRVTPWDMTQANGEPTDLGSVPQALECLVPRDEYVWFVGHDATYRHPDRFELVAPALAERWLVRDAAGKPWLPRSTCDWMLAEAVATENALCGEGWLHAQFDLHAIYRAVRLCGWFPWGRYAQADGRPS